MKFSGVTLVSDMDGTLLTDDKTISRENIEKINYFRENGGIFTVATGRIHKKIKMFSHAVDFTPTPVISHNGGVIYDFKKNEILYAQYLEGNYKKTIADIFEEYPYIGVEAYTDADVLFMKRNEFTDKHIEDEQFLTGKKEITWYDFYDYPDEKWCKILMAVSVSDMKNLKNTLPQKYPEYSFVESDAHYYEILPKNVNKGSAVKILQKIIGSGANKLYAIGDNMNDAQLLDAAHVGIAVKNASDELKKRADVILPYTNEQNAVARVIEMIEREI